MHKIMWGPETDTQTARASIHEPAPLSQLNRHPTIQGFVSSLQMAGEAKCRLTCHYAHYIITSCLI